MADPEEMDSLYYEVNTGVREGSILSPLLYILFIDARAAYQTSQKRAGCGPE